MRAPSMLCFTRATVLFARRDPVRLSPQQPAAWPLQRSPAMVFSSGKAARQPKALASREGETVELPGGVVSKDLWFTVPLRWEESRSKDTIDVFARELVLTSAKDEKSRPYLVFLQGGPGFPSPRVANGGSGWISRALREFRVVLVDQRGTGRSAPITHASLTKLGSAKAAADLLKHFRAPDIVRDCEAIRRALTGDKGRPWTVLGQSYGGFCLLTYLSLFPAAVAAGLFTGGLPPLPQRHSPDEVYRATYKRLAERNRRFYARYPNDVAQVKKIVRHLCENQVVLPGGGLLTPRRFVQLGLGLSSGGYFETLHYLVAEALDDSGAPTYSFLRQVEAQQPFETNPIYALLHEAIYCEGYASAWAAQRVLREQPAFAWQDSLDDPERPIYFTAEMIFPWMFEDYAMLRGLGEAAEILASSDDWSQLYDENVLSKCNVPCAAAVYYDDAYVEREFSEETAALLPNCKLFITNQYQHSGLRDDGANLLDKLLGMTRGTVDLPS